MNIFLNLILKFRLIGFLVFMVVIAGIPLAGLAEKEQQEKSFFQTSSSSLYTVSPTDDPVTVVYPIIASLQPGDIVEFAPGKYEYRISFQTSGMADQPIVLRAQDPDNRPIFDLSGDDIWINSDQDDWIGNWPGNGGSNRAIWEFSNVAYFDVSGFVFRGAHQSQWQEDGAGIRIVDNVNYNIETHHIHISNCLFENNDNGVQGGGDNILYEYCEFRENGCTDIQFDLGADGTHNMYIHGGDLTVRFSHLHDPRRGQNFHCRAKNARFEYNVIENGYNYMGDIMTNKTDRSEGQAITQELTLLGNLIIEKENPGNDSKVFAFYNDANWANTSMRMNLFYNTFIGNGKNEAMLRIYQNNNMIYQEAFFYNNIFYGNHKPFNIDSNLDPSDYHLECKNNWWPDGYDYSAYSVYMSDSFFGVELGFNDPAIKDYSLTGLSQVKEVANNEIAGIVIPQFEPNTDVLSAVSIPRNDAVSLGAYEYKDPATTILKLQIKVFLQGLYDSQGDSMITTLYDNGDIPLISPYSEAPETVGDIPDNIVDWILLQIRASDGLTLLENYSLFLRNDGRIVDENGNSEIELTGLADNHYYILVKHRNHLSIMSASPIDFSTGSLQEYDFTDHSESIPKIYGTAGGTELATGIWGMWSGDINRDGEITTLDYTEWYNASVSGIEGYLSTDLNLDGLVTTVDYELWNHNAKQGASSQAP